MSKYTTGEIASLCGVTVRTVQYYDTRGILVPAELSEGGRRLYSEDDLRKMKVICFLRGLGLPLDAISQLLSEEHPENVVTLLLGQQEKLLRDEISERREKLKKLEELQSEIKGMENFSVESIGDIAYTMNGKKKLRKIHLIMLLTGIPVSLLQLGSIALWILTGQWWLFAVWTAVAVTYGILISRWYLKSVAYLCPKCHKVFQPGAKEAFFANHTPSARKLTCPSCGHKGFCVEVIKEDEGK